MDPHRRAPKKNKSHGNNVLPQDPAHLIQRPCYQQSWLTFIRSGQNHLARHREKGEEDKADRGKGGRTTSGNAQAVSSPNRRGQWRAGKNGGNWLRNHKWRPNDPGGEGIDERHDTLAPFTLKGPGPRAMQRHGPVDRNGPKALFPSIHGLAGSNLTFESAENTAVSSHVVSAVCVFDVMNKAGMCGTTVYCKVSQPFCAVRR